MPVDPAAGRHTAHAHHHPGHIHPPAAIGMSLLRLSGWRRLGIAAVLAALVWLAAYWAL